MQFTLSRLALRNWVKTNDPQSKCQHKLCALKFVHARYAFAYIYLKNNEYTLYIIQFNK